MTDGGRRIVWLRMPDLIGVTEPGKKPVRPSPGILLLQMVGYTAMTVVFTALVFRTQDYIVFLIAGGTSLILAVASFVVWIQYIRSDHSKPPGDFENGLR